MKVMAGWQAALHDDWETFPWLKFNRFRSLLS
jgi:hypothetical protein